MHGGGTERGALGQRWAAIEKLRATAEGADTWQRDEAEPPNTGKNNKKKAEGNHQRSSGPLTEGPNVVKIQLWVTQPAFATSKTVEVPKLLWQCTLLLTYSYNGEVFHKAKPLLRQFQPVRVTLPPWT